MPVKSKAGPGCPFRNFEACPEHNKSGGCTLWLAYAGTSPTTGTEVNMEGCGLALSALLNLDQISSLGRVAAEVRQVSAELSAARCEHIKEAEASRAQWLNLAQGRPGLIRVEHNHAAKPALINAAKGENA